MFDAAILESWLEKGLCCGTGDGQNTACVEQAIALAFGYPLTDHPEMYEDSQISPSSPIVSGHLMIRLGQALRPVLRDFVLSLTSRLVPKASIRSSSYGD